MRINFIVFIIGLGLSGTVLNAQGPPIRLDKPIMLGSGESTVRALYNYINTDQTNYSMALLMADHNVTSDFAVEVEIPWVFSSDWGSDRPGDMSVMLKYQFYRKDGMGKTTRIAAKAKHSFPTGRELKVPIAGMGHHKTYFGTLAAYESLSLGVQAEVGYYVVPGESDLNMLSYQLGVALPLLPPAYPTNQINVYLEADGMNMRGHEGHSQFGYYIAPGLQYARGKFTVEASVRFPISQDLPIGYEQNWNLLAGGRMVL